jgi:two-component system, chemotaxis family, protein-glutamate methylesterase/glutaminase
MRVLVVDDTVTFRHIISRALEGIAGVEVVGTAADGKIALQKVELLRPDLLTLDVEMPGMGGLEVLRRLRESGTDVGVIMLSAFTTEGAKVTLEALQMGAFDFVVKPSGESSQINAEKLRRNLALRIEAFCRAREIRKILYTRAPDAGPSPPATDRSPSLRGCSRTASEFVGQPPPAVLGFSSQPRAAVPQVVLGHPLSAGNKADRAAERPPASPIAPAETRPWVGRYEVAAVGISTGGPQALMQMLPQLPANLAVPVLIVQHMPPMFTRSLAEDLNNRCPLQVCEAISGQPVLPGWVLIAPGGKQMKVDRFDGQPVIRVTDDPPVNSCQPSVDYLFRSVAKVYGRTAIGVLMTGMGNDGAAGCRLLHKLGAPILAQNEASCVVFGMPREPIAEGIAKAVPLDHMAHEIVRIAGYREPQFAGDRRRHIGDILAGA